MIKKRTLRRIGLVVLMLVGTLGLVAWVTLTWVMIRPPSFVPSKLLTVQLRSWPEHDAIYQSTPFPYVLSVENERGAIEYVGALHTSDANHPQLDEIESRWKQFKPTVAFCEGRERMYRFASRPESGVLSESRCVRILAYQNGIPLFSLEPSYSDEVAALLRRFDPELVTTYLVLRAFVSESKGVPKSQRDGLALRLIRKRSNVDGLNHSVSTIEDLDRFWAREFPGMPDWRTLETTEQIPLLREVGDASREIRGQHMISSITELAANGERVFAVVGASHVIRQELEIRRLIQ